MVSEKYDASGMKGDIHTGGGTKMASFKNGEGNTMAIIENVTLSKA